MGRNAADRSGTLAPVGEEVRMCFVVYRVILICSNLEPFQTVGVFVCGTGENEPMYL